MKNVWHSILMYLYDKSIIEFDVFNRLKDIFRFNSYLKADEYLFSFKEGKQLGEKTYDLLSKLLLLIWNEV